MKFFMFSALRLVFVSVLAFLSIEIYAVEIENPAAKAIHNVPPTDRIIIKYKNSASSVSTSRMFETAMDQLSHNAGTKLRHLRELATGAQLIKLQRRMSGAELAGVISRLQQDPSIEYVEADLLLQALAVPNDPKYDQQWHYFEPIAGVNLQNAWDITQGNGVVVAVIDSGYRPHADLVANILPGYDMISDLGVAQDGNGRDSDARDPGSWEPAGACGPGSPAKHSNWHGTHVAGTIAAVTNNGVGVAGVASKAKIVPIRVLGRCGGYTSDTADAIIWGAGGKVSGVPNNTNPAKVLNLSLGGKGTCSNTTQNAINTARNLGATVVVSAGNSSENASLHQPANCSGVISVASVDRSGGRAWYSNYGSVVDLAAPGGDTSVSTNGVLSLVNTGSQAPGGDSYAFYQGTSMAAPHVSGVAALLYSLEGNLTPSEVETILKDTARGFPAGCNQCGAGIVDATAALSSVVGSPIVAPPKIDKLSCPTAGGGSTAIANCAVRLSGGPADKIEWFLNGAHYSSFDGKELFTASIRCGRGHTIKVEVANGSGTATKSTTAYSFCSR